ncbi:MAG: hypothetical protein ACOYB2_10755 [Limnohabitans sp.]
MADLIRDIVEGRLDDELDAISTAIKTRRELRRTMEAATLRVGTRVVINDRCRPAYLQGRTAVVVKVAGKSATLKFDETPGGRFRSSEIRCPIGLFDVLAESESLL